MKIDPYRFANLSQSEVQEITGLEKRLKQETGKDITLIAYAKGAQSGTSEANGLSQKDTREEDDGFVNEFLW